jgi:hypothetical protein
MAISLPGTHASDIVTRVSFQTSLNARVVWASHHVGDGPYHA